jgi:hypothetical protein
LASVDAPHTILHSDGLSAYGRLARAGLEHVRIVQGPDRSQGVRRLPWSHVIFSNLKSWMRGTFHGVSPAYLPRYLDEFSFRYDRRSRADELAALVLGRALRSDPMPLFRLRAELRGRASESGQGHHPPPPHNVSRGEALAAWSCAGSAPSAELPASTPTQAASTSAARVAWPAPSPVRHDARPERATPRSIHRGRVMVPV